jgi:putative hydrolase of the HAD superfamily
MIGNSLRTDIVPALESGIHAIFIPADNEWNYNIVEVKSEPAGAYLTISSLNQVPNAINAYLKNR